MDTSNTPPDLTTDQIRLWLKANPDFFALHPDLLPTPSQSNVFSLETGQLNALRQRNEQLSQNVEAMLERIRRNERIYTAFHTIQIQILTAQGGWEMILAATKAPEQLFDIHRTTVAISDRATKLMALFQSPPTASDTQNRLFTIHHKELTDTLRESTTPIIRMGLEGKNRALFFGDSSHEIRSEALVPLFSHPNAGPDGLIGSLNLGGQTPSRFLPSDSTDLLRNLADILGLCLSRLVA